jgi:hypothetical protein
MKINGYELAIMRQTREPMIVVMRAPQKFKLRKDYVRGEGSKRRKGKERKGR